MKKFLRHVVVLQILLVALVAVGCSSGRRGEFSPDKVVFSFDVTADMVQFAKDEYQSSQYFLGACEAIEEIGKGSFMVSPGDLRPPQDVYSTVKKVLGDDYPWYPVVGNHEYDKPEYMVWLRKWASKDIPYLVRRGPKDGQELVYSFDYQNAHLVVINQYYDDKSDKHTDGNIAESLSSWLEEDLAANEKPFVFVFGHEPVVSIPDYDNGRHRHKGDNLDAHPESSHRFQQLLRKHEVTAYVCGHTHNFSYAKINGLWQIDAGHARGIGDKGAPSTFLKFLVGKDSCWTEVYRDDSKGGSYSLTRRILLD